MIKFCNIQTRLPSFFLCFVRIEPATVHSPVDPDEPLNRACLLASSHQITLNLNHRKVTIKFGHFSFYEIWASDERVTLGKTKRTKHSGWEPV